MRSSTKVSPPNSLVFISDVNGGKAPIPIRDASIQSTPSCVTVACYPEQDGKTEIILGDAQDVDPGEPANFDGSLDTPNHAVIVSTVEEEKLLEAKVSQTRVRIRIWVNHPRWPDRVIIGLG